MTNIIPIFKKNPAGQCVPFSKRWNITASRWNVSGIPMKTGSATKRSDRITKPSVCTSAVLPAMPLCRMKTSGSRKPPDNVPIALGGLGEEERALQMFCPHCGRQFSGEEVNVQNRESAILCPKCQQTFRLSEMYRFVPEPILGLSEAEQCTLPELPELRTEQNEDTLTVTYTPSPTLKKILGIFGAEIFFTLFFGTLFSLFVFLVFGMSGEERQKGFFVAMTVCSAAFFMYFAVLPRVFYSMLEHYDAYRGLYASWSIQIDRHRFVIHRHYNGDSETVSYDRREIRRICLKECNYSDFPSPLWGRFPSLLCNAGRGGIELVLRDGTVECLPHITCITFNQHDRVREANNRIQNSRWVNYLNRRPALFA